MTRGLFIRRRYREVCAVDSNSWVVDVWYADCIGVYWERIGVIVSDEHSMRSLESALREEIGGMIETIKEEPYPEDMLTELADGWTPIYTSDILAYAANDIALATAEPEVGPAFDGSPTPVNIIAANIYERLQAVAFEVWQDILDSEEAEDE